MAVNQLPIHAPRALSRLVELAVGKCNVSGTVRDDSVCAQPVCCNNAKDGTYEVIAIGPVIMMKFVSLLTKPWGLRTNVSLNPIMVDGTGMCGGCRVTVGGQTKFACVDGPDFDGHQVDYDELMRRQSMYKTEEAHSCKIGLRID